MSDDTPWIGMFGDEHPKRVPVFLITGFLGSGKTTLIRELLGNPDLADTALIINEFGEVGLDQMLVQTAVENTLLLENGCVCCSIRGDLADTVGDLFAKMQAGDIPTFSRIIIETTGLADPGPIIQDMAQTPSLTNRVALAKVIVTVDGVLGKQQLVETTEVPSQVAHADLCLVTKSELADRNEINRLVEDLQGINPIARVELAHLGRVDVAMLLAPIDIQGRSERPVSSLRCEGGDACSRPDGTPCPDHPGATAMTYPGSLQKHLGVQSWSAQIEKHIEWAKLRDWLDLIYSLHASHILRMKGVFQIAGESRPVVMHAVGALVGEPSFLDAWPAEGKRSHVVVITKELDANTIGRIFDTVVLDAAAMRHPPDLDLWTS